ATEHPTPWLRQCCDAGARRNAQHSAVAEALAQWWTTLRAADARHRRGEARRAAPLRVLPGQSVPGRLLPDVDPGWASAAPRPVVNEVAVRGRHPVPWPACSSSRMPPRRRVYTASLHDSRRSWYGLLPYPLLCHRYDKLPCRVQHLVLL